MNYILIIILLIVLIIIIFINNTKEHFSNKYNYNVIFAGTVKNCEPYIKNTLIHVDECGKKFNSYAVIIYENDSTDNTRKILNENKKINYYYIFEDNITEPRRTMRLANGRNKIIEKMKELNGYDYLIMLDMDDINNSGKFVETIDTNFKHKNWNVLTGNQTTNYYDIWALRQVGYIDYDCHKDPTTETKNIIENTHYEGNRLIPVKSAFGGIAIYKISAIKNCKYIGEYQDKTELCEHVEFNKCIGNVFINPEFYTY